MKAGQAPTRLDFCTMSTVASMTPSQEPCGGGTVHTHGEGVQQEGHGYPPESGVLQGPAPNMTGRREEDRADGISGAQGACQQTRQAGMAQTQL